MLCLNKLFDFISQKFSYIGQYKNSINRNPKRK